MTAPATLARNKTVRSAVLLVAIFLVTGLTQVLLDTSLMADFFTGRNDMLFWRTLAVTLLVGGVKGLRGYVTAALAEDPHKEIPGDQSS